MTAHMSGSDTVSLVIPLYNEEKTISALIASIRDQVVQPDEVIFYNGSSDDRTLAILNDLTGNDPRYKVITGDRAMPGEARNRATSAATGTWIAYTDAGIKLDRGWLKELTEAAKENPQSEIIYGDYTPQRNSFFEKCAAIAYTEPKKPKGIRGRFIASCLVRKTAWERVGGFPKWRAAEDLIFMEEIEKSGLPPAFAPSANVYWLLRTNLKDTFRRFSLYSKNNVWANRQAYWHYGILKQYLLVAVLTTGVSFFSLWGLLLIPCWYLARVLKRLFVNRYEYGLPEMMNPVLILNVFIITLTIDIATFTGWWNALVEKRNEKK